MTPYLLAAGLWVLGTGCACVLWRRFERRWVRGWQRAVNGPWGR